MRLFAKLDGTTHNKFDRAATISIPFDLYFGPTFGVSVGGHVRNKSAVGADVSASAAISGSVTADSAVGASVEVLT